MQNGQIVKSRPTNHGTDYILVPGKHPAILDQETFYAIAERRGKSPKVNAIMNCETRSPGWSIVELPDADVPWLSSSLQTTGAKFPAGQKA